MSLCKVCSQEIVRSIPVPSWHPDERSDRAFVHEECFPGSFCCPGSATTKAGIAENLYEQRPRLLVADEIDNFEAKDIAILLSPAETGIVRETTVSKQREVRLNTSIFAPATPAKDMPEELLSRFRVLCLPPYTKEKFIEASTKVLVEREKVEPDLAAYIADRAWEVSRDVREATRIGRICQNGYEANQDAWLIGNMGWLETVYNFRGMHNNEGRKYGNRNGQQQNHN